MNANYALPFTIMREATWPTHKERNIRLIWLGEQQRKLKKLLHNQHLRK